VNLPKSAMPPELVIDVQMVTEGTKWQVLKIERDRTGRQERAEDVDVSELHEVLLVEVVRRSLCKIRPT